MITYAYNKCEIIQNKENFYKCAEQWSLFRDREKWPATRFLTDDFVIKEICLGDVSIKDVDECIRNSVDPDCDGIYAYWKGTKDKYQFICKWRQEFISHYQCRENRFLTKAVNRCVSKQSTGGNYCESGASVRRCLFRALKAYCSEEAREFFQVVFDLELAPSLLYAGCEDYVEEFHTPAPVESIDSSREKKRDSDRSLPTRRKQNGVRISVDFEVGSNGKIPMQSISVIQILSLLMLLYVFGVH